MQRVNIEEIDFTNDYRYVYQGRPFTGVACEHAKDGRLVCEIAIVGGVREGTSREWYKSGGLMSETTCKYGAFHGTCIDWYENGRTKEEKLYEFGICLERKSWDENGSLIGESFLDENDPQYDLLKLLRKRYLSM